MIEPSQNLQNVFEFSVNVARQLQHEYITIEHLGLTEDDGKPISHLSLSIPARCIHILDSKVHSQF